MSSPLKMILKANPLNCRVKMLAVLIQQNGDKAEMPKCHKGVKPYPASEVRLVIL